MRCPTFRRKALKHSRRATTSILGGLNPNVSLNKGTKTLISPIPSLTPAFAPSVDVRFQLDWCVDPCFCLPAKQRPVGLARNLDPRGL